MKFIASLCSGILIFALIFSVLPINGEEQIYDSMIRLHVIANSDSEFDQKIKLEVRDAVVKFMESQYNNPQTKDEAAEIISNDLDMIKVISDSITADLGYTSNVFLDFETYPTRYYDDIELPAGKYLSLRIVLGGGEGKNWWCILFPPLCLSGSLKIESDSDEMEAFIAAGLTPEQYKIIKNEKTPTYKIKFKILEILSQVFNKGE